MPGGDLAPLLPLPLTAPLSEFIDLFKRGPVGEAETEADGLVMQVVQGTPIDRECSLDASRQDQKRPRNTAKAKAAS